MPSPVIFPTRQQRADQIRQLLATTLNSADIQQAVRDARFLDVRRVHPDNTVLTNLTNEQTLQVVLTGEETGSASDGDLDLRVELYHRVSSSAIGYSADGVIYPREHFFKTAALAEVAEHWLHEWSHAAGFEYAFDRTSHRDQSVPYQLGQLLTDHASVGV